MLTGANRPADSRADNLPYKLLVVIIAWLFGIQRGGRYRRHCSLLYGDAAFFRREKHTRTRGISHQKRNTKTLVSKTDRDSSLDLFLLVTYVTLLLWREMMRPIYRTDRLG